MRELVQGSIVPSEVTAQGPRALLERYGWILDRPGREREGRPERREEQGQRQGLEAFSISGLTVRADFKSPILSVTISVGLTLPI